MTPYEALYKRPYRSPICWEEVGERKLVGLELVEETIEKVIRKYLLTIQNK